jgi:hypothetical protein
MNNPVPKEDQFVVIWHLANYGAYGPYTFEEATRVAKTRYNATVVKLTKPLIG